MQIITHRGLDPSLKNYFGESSLEAFQDQLNRGFGLEFDIQFTSDGEVVVIHDASLERLTNSKDKRKIDEILSSEFLSMEFNGCHLTSLRNLLGLINKKQVPGVISAIHLKHNSQEPGQLDKILSLLKSTNTDKFIIFDVTLVSAQYLKNQNPNLKLALSVAHPNDIKRYSRATGGTLYPIETVLAHRDLFDWVWLDEWDLADENGKEKKLYEKVTFDRLHTAGLKIALVTPELHGTSPGLLGGEAHPSARNINTLQKRLKEIIGLGSDAVCTDYPDLARSIEAHKLAKTR